VLSYSTVTVTGTIRFDLTNRLVVIIQGFTKHYSKPVRPVIMKQSNIGIGMAGMALFSSCLLDLLLCPHSKVEESFPLQATHDIFYHGITPAIRNIIFTNIDAELPYDHLQYPGGALLQSLDGPFSSVLLQSALALIIDPIAYDVVVFSCSFLST
jgi:hypothetical protein